MKGLLETLVGAIMMFVLFILPVGLAGNVQNHYTKEMIVTSVRNDSITVKDADDEVWVFYGEGFSEGDRVKVRMFTNCTDTDFSDDEIVSIKIIKK